MERSGQPLEDYIEGKIYRGLLTGFNKAFVISGEKRRQLIAEHASSKELIKPLAVGDDVRKWQIDRDDKWIIVTQIGVKIKEYPAIFRHLKQFQSELEIRQDQGDHWWELRACNYYGQFERPKIVFPEIAKEPRFAFDSKGIYTNNKAFFIARSDLFLLGVLNSTPAWEYARTICAVLGDEQKGGRVMLQWVNFKKLPIPKADDRTKDQVSELAKQCLTSDCRKRDEIERQLDLIVSSLYGLNSLKAHGRG
jgi:hypothetical protein